MKINFKLLGLTAVSALMITSCAEGDKVIDDIFDTTTRGAVLRTVSSSGTFNRFDTSTEFTATIEEQDVEDGGLLEKVEIFASFADNTAANGTTTATESLIKTVTASEFEVGPFGLPRTTFSSTLAEALSGLGISEGQFDGGDAIVFRLALTLTDGRTFTDSDNTGTITGSFFSSPFRYNQIIKCIPTAPVAGDYEFKLFDNYGDGWDGAFITVVLDGVSTDYTVDSGSNNDFTLNVPDGTTQFDLTYTPGNFEGEHEYEIIAPTGETAIADGPSPSVGEIVFNICNG